LYQFYYRNYKERNFELVRKSPAGLTVLVVLNVYVQNMWEIEKIQRKAESLTGFKNVSTILPLQAILPRLVTGRG
jgi:hypothetical protein